MRISDWSSDVCSSDLPGRGDFRQPHRNARRSLRPLPMTDIWPDHLFLVGCGNMAGQMLRRWLACGLDPARATVLRPSGRAVAQGVEIGRAHARTPAINAQLVCRIVLRKTKYKNN